MNRVVSALLALLRAGLWNKVPQEPDVFPLSEDEWQAVYVEARRQTVTGVVYRGISLLQGEMMPPRKLKLRWMIDIDCIEQRSRAMNKAVLQLTGRFDKMGVLAVVQKGQGVAALYDEPSGRECGDIDLFFPRSEERQRAEEWLRNQGVATVGKPDGSTFYVWNKVDVEHHAHLVDLQSPRVQPFVEELVARKGFVAMDIDSEGHIRVPAPELNLLMLNTHILKHVMGRGIGLRQLCDMARAYAVLGRQVDGQELKQIYRQSGIARWSRLLHAFLVNELSLPAHCLPYEDKAEKSGVLLDIVLSGGNFGQYGKDGNAGDEKAWKRKLKTCRAFCRNVGFSLKYAPQEAVYTFGHLIKGQFK